MKITVPVNKPRAKWLNDILLSKRSEGHANPKRSTRSSEKKELRKELQQLIPGNLEQ